jgi:hypothetical protein
VIFREGFARGVYQESKNRIVAGPSFTHGVRAYATKPTKIEAKDWAAQKEHEIKTSAGEKKRPSHLVRQRRDTNLSSAVLSGGRSGSSAKLTG